MVSKKILLWNWIKALKKSTSLPFWDFFNVSDDDVSKFTANSFIRNRNVRLNDISDRSNIFFIPKVKRGIIVIGHGDKNGLLSNFSRFTKSKTYLLTKDTISSISHSPILIWACWSGIWLKESGSNNWFGFANRIGYDLGNDLFFWKKYLTKYLNILFKGANNAIDLRTLHQYTEREYYKSIRLFQCESISYVTLLLTNAFNKYTMHSNSFQVEKSV
jgi:hypothetical protein